MSDLPNDDAPDALGGSGGSPTPGEAWTPPTDAGSENAAATHTEAAPARAKAPPRRAPSGDEPQRRRPSATAAAPEAVPATGSDDSAEPVEATPPGERIAKAMARAGIASRRDAEVMILAGRVSVNGETIASPALNVTDADRILIDGEPMPTRERSRLWIFHKPRGLVTTARDPEGRQTVFEVLPEDLPRVVAVGRLDINTEGLLLLTNDGGLAKVIAHPDTGWLRRYRVRAHGDTDQAQLDRLSKGVTIDGMEYGPIEATLDRVQGDNLWLTLGLREGKNREVKRILEHLGLSVNRLIRLSFGPFQLGDLESGLVEEIRTRVLKDQLGKTLAEQAGVDFESPVREAIAPFGGAAREVKGGAGRSGGTRGGRDAARPAPTPRVSTGGTGSGPRRSVWSADADSEGPRGLKIPRRGSDPRAAQAASAERGRERVGSIRSGERRVVVERLSATPPEPVAEEAPRRRYADRGAPSDRPPRHAGGRSGGDAFGGRAPARGDGRPRDAGGARDAGRPARAYAGAETRSDDRRTDDRRPDDRRGGGRPDGRRDGPSGAAPAEGGYRGKGGFQDRDGFKPRDGFKARDDAKPRGDFKGSGDLKPRGDFKGKGGFKSGDGAPAKGGFRDRNAAPGGSRPASGGGKPGGFGGGKPGFGGKPGGFGGGKPGFGAARSGARPGGKPGGKPGGGFRGGAKPGGGGGRPPRGDR